MTVKTIESIFNKHPVKSIAVTVCITCLILAYLTFGSGIINWDNIDQNNMQVVAQYEESEVEKDTYIKSEDDIEKITETENSEIENAQVEAGSNIEKITVYAITGMVIILEIAMLIFLVYLFIDLFRT